MSHPQYFQSHSSTELLCSGNNQYLIFIFFFYVLWDLKKQSKTKTHCSSKHKSKPKSRRNEYKSIRLEEKNQNSSNTGIPVHPPVRKYSKVSKQFKFH